MQFIFKAAFVTFCVFLGLQHSAQAFDFQGSALEQFLSQNLQSEKDWVQSDLENILQNAGLKKRAIQFEVASSASRNSTKVICEKDRTLLKIASTEAEWSSTLYKALREMGFLFPHPNRQISPSADQIKMACGRTIEWKPRLALRGFHLHNMHPNEWVDGLFLNEKNKGNAMAIVPWLKRNGQNLLQVQMIKTPTELYSNHLGELLKKAKAAKILTALSVSFSLYQQRGMYLIPWYMAFTGWGAETRLRNRITELQSKYDFQIMTFEIGTTEFSSAPYEKTLRWIEVARQALEKENQMIFTKIHASTDQNKEPYGNFNYLPQYANKSVGVLPHTVMAYSLNDKHAPVYGLESFESMRQYFIDQSQARPTIYYPETSYYCSMDIDLPLFLTDYLVSRSEDMSFIEGHPTWGQVNFTTGHEMGYWLMDWTVALLADADHKDDPMVGLKLLGENPQVWKSILEFQETHFKKNQLIQYISFANLQDDLNVFGDPSLFVHYRKLLRDYFHNPANAELQVEIEKLEAAVKELPSTEGIKNRELKILVDVTFLRVKHALYLRKSIAEGRPEDGQANLLGFRSALAATPQAKNFISEASSVRKEAYDLLQEYKNNYLAYPGSLASECKDNPTSYVCGYAWTATTLYHWKREEEVVDKRIYNPFYKSYYKALRHLF